MTVVQTIWAIAIRKQDYDVQRALNRPTFSPDTRNRSVFLYKKGSYQFLKEKSAAFVFGSL